MAVGGGGLIGGIAAYVKSLWPAVEVIGVEPSDADAMTRSLACGERVSLEQVGLFADGVAVRQVGRAHLRPGPALRGRDGDGGHRRDLRRHQGRLRGHPLDPRTGRRPGGGRDEGGRGTAGPAGADPGGRGLRRQHEL